MHPSFLKLEPVGVFLSGRGRGHNRTIDGQDCGDAPLSKETVRGPALGHAGPLATIECLFGQIELLAKATGYFGKLRLAVVIDLRTLAD
jgi:hypothetical protein